MNDIPKSTRLETEALIIGYAMSRLDGDYLGFRNVSSWRAAYDEASRALSVKPISFRNLRDEFDPFHSNKRLGWHKRQMMPSRQRVLEDLKEVSDDALKALIDRILLRDADTITDVVDSLVATPRPVHNVAERLLTGRRAEEYFLAHCESLIGHKRSELIDHRYSACGFDFGIVHLPMLCIEIKGLKRTKGGVLFTDREWSEAKLRRDNYSLVVIGNMDATPRGKVVKDPYQNLDAACSYQVTVAASWKVMVTVAS
jgi:hypothetical protein